MRAAVLGPLRIERDGAEIPLHAPKERAIVSILAIRAPEFVGPDVLIDAAWGAGAPIDAPALFYTAVDRLRAQLGADAIEEVDGRYRLAIDAAQVDVNQFTAAVSVDASATPARREWLEAALALWRGPALQDLAPSSGARVEIRALEDLRHRVEEDLVASMLAAEQWADAISRSEQLVEAQPMRGRRWALLVVGLVHAQRVEEGRHAYQRAHEMLDPAGIRGLDVALLDSSVIDALGVPTPTRGERPRSGLRTFVFTDIEGSTNLWQRHPDAMTTALETHDRLLREICARHSGECFTHLGDGLGMAFVDPRNALSASNEIQSAVAVAPWPPATPLKVRIGIHFGFADFRDGNYLGTPVNVCARINSLAHGGQTLVSAATVDLAAPVETIPLGAYPLRGVDEPVEVHQLGEGDFGPLRGTDPTRTNLPPAGTTMVGRDEEVREIRAMLTTSPVVTITGPGGSGKTRLAVEVAHEELLNRTAGAYFVDLSGVSDDLDVGAAVAGALRLTVGADGPTAAVLEHLGDQDTLVVIDNCEHVVEGVAEFAEAVASIAGGARLLATSQGALDIDTERVHVLGPLAADGVDSPAVQLLVDRVRRTDPSFVLDEITGPKAVEICRRLDGLPLALELAASRLGVLSLDDLGRHLEDRFSVLRSGGRRRSRTMEATVAWSYGLLEPDDQRCFRLLGVFAGSFDVEAAAAVIGSSELETIDRLEDLVASSLLTVERAGARHRFRLLETLRAYARLRLVDQDELTAARDAHLEHHLATFVPSDGTVLIPSRSVAQARHVHSDLVAAYSHATASDRWEDAARLSFLLTSVSAMAGTGVPTGLEVVRERFGPDHEIGGMLLVARLLHAVAIDDWGRAIRIAQDATISPFPAVAGTGCWLLAFTNAMIDSPIVERMLSDAAGHLAAIEPDSHNARSVAAGITYTRAAPAAMRGDLETARASCREWYRAGPYAELVATEPHLLAELAVVEIIDGNPALAVDLLDRDDVDEFLQASAVVVKVAALALDGNAAAAKALAVPFAREALLGRIARLSNDAAVGLAAVLLATGEIDDARALLLAARGARAPHIGLLAAHLADLAGCRAEVEAMQSDSVYTRADARPDVEAALGLPTFA
ncbi:BTAD domain-containing putative transcriptional regulator [Actinospongicola halichondriae]|uniref:BTAD domain-containing putative transcriptional regulator n=1 Tax=Actinospongicola halichondriae TaxID=3236844 RepID=UPI003D54064B